MTNSDYTDLAVTLGLLHAAISYAETAIEIDETSSSSYCEDLREAVSTIIHIHARISRDLKLETR